MDRATAIFNLILLSKPGVPIDSCLLSTKLAHSVDEHIQCPARVSLFCFNQKDAKRSKTKQNEAKKMRKQTLSRPEEAKLSKKK
jgi:hypothetical protein